MYSGYELLGNSIPKTLTNPQYLSVFTM